MLPGNSCLELIWPKMIPKLKQWNTVRCAEGLGHAFSLNGPHETDSSKKTCRNPWPSNFVCRILRHLSGCPFCLSCIFLSSGQKSASVSILADSVFVFVGNLRGWSPGKLLRGRRNVPHPSDGLMAGYGCGKAWFGGPFHSISLLIY